MKKILSLALSTFAFVSVKAQVPQKVSTPLIYVITATWDGSYGSWGWKLANDLIADTKDKALFVGLFPSADSSRDNHKFYTSTSEDLAYRFGLGCYPSFGCNDEDKTDGSRDRNVIQKNVMDAVNGFVRLPPIASCANSMKITGSKITVDARVKFWFPTSGDYYLAAYIIEDKAKNQLEYFGESVAFQDVMRGSMTSSAWGEPIATGSIAANSNYSKTFSFDIKDASWVKANLKVYTVIWSNSGSRYYFVNSKASENPVPASAATISGVEELKIIPNPAGASNTTLYIHSNSDKRVNLTVIDISGRSVYSATNIKISQGQNNIEIPTQDFAGGLYEVRVDSGFEQMTEKLSVLK
jgi:hypothetical protein